MSHEDYSDSGIGVEAYKSNKLKYDDLMRTNKKLAVWAVVGTIAAFFIGLAVGMSFF